MQSNFATDCIGLLVGMNPTLNHCLKSTELNLSEKVNTLGVGKDADVTVFDADAEWTYDRMASASKSRNSPFGGWRMKGRVIATVVAGKIVHREI